MQIEIVVLAWGFESSHPSLLHSRRLVGVLRPVVQSLMLAMLYTLERLVFSSFVAFEFVRHYHSSNKALLLEEVTEESWVAAFVSRWRCIKMPLHLAFTIHCSPQVILLPFNCNNNLTLDAIYRLDMGVYSTPDERIAAQISDTILEWTLRSLRYHDRVSFSQRLGSSRERCNRARRSSWWFRRGIGNGSTWTSSREPSGSTTSILLPVQVDNTKEI